MKIITPSKRGFTLVELLVTATLFAVVAGYSVAIFSATVATSARSQRSRGAVSQTRQSLESLKRAFERSPITSTVKVITTNEPNYEGAMVVFTTMIPDNIGKATSATQMRAYCPELNTDTQRHRLVMFTITGTYVGGPTSAACSTIGVATLFDVGATVSAPTYLTDAVTDVQAFRVAPVQYTTNTPNPNPMAIRLLITTVYDPGTVDPTAVFRADDAQQPLPITIRTTALRVHPGEAQPFSGL